MLLTPHQSIFKGQIMLKQNIMNSCPPNVCEKGRTPSCTLRPVSSNFFHRAHHQKPMAPYVLVRYFPGVFWRLHWFAKNTTGGVFGISMQPFSMTSSRWRCHILIYEETNFDEIFSPPMQPQDLLGIIFGCIGGEKKNAKKQPLVAFGAHDEKKFAVNGPEIVFIMTNTWTKPPK